MLQTHCSVPGQFDLPGLRSYGKYVLCPSVLSVTAPHALLWNTWSCFRRNDTHPSSPVSRKPSFRRLDRKRSTFRIFDQECKRLKRIADENAVAHFNKFHRTFSTSQLESSCHYDSSPECSYSLSVVKTRESKDFAFRRIESSVLAELLANEEEFEKNYLLIDCRYPYEYNGGHIKVRSSLFHISKYLYMDL